MISRCYNPKNKRFADWGGRGITVCGEWRNDRTKFFAWALANGYMADLQIDRVENDEGYSPFNCRWITQQTNVSNTRKNRLLTWNSKTMTATSWARELGVTQQALQHRLSRDWSIERIFTQPFKGRV
jgi:hypothetical protein